MDSLEVPNKQVEGFDELSHVAEVVAEKLGAGLVGAEGLDDRDAGA